MYAPLFPYADTLCHSDSELCLIANAPLDDTVDDTLQPLTLECLYCGDDIVLCECTGY